MKGMWSTRDVQEDKIVEALNAITPDYTDHLFSGNSRHSKRSPIFTFYILVIRYLGNTHDNEIIIAQWKVRPDGFSSAAGILVILGLYLKNLGE